MDDKTFQRREKYKLLTAGIICLIIVITVVGYTYSFFTATATNNSVITGKVESTMLSLLVEEVVPKNNAKLIPQLDSAITSAVTGRKGNCIDDNNNTVCKVYSVTIKNLNSTAPIYVNANLALSANSSPHLKWALVSGIENPILRTDVKPYTESTLLSEEEYAPNEENTYYIVLWISETGLIQNDSGNFTGTLTVENVTPSPSYEQIDSSGANAPR